MEGCPGTAVRAVDGIFKNGADAAIKELHCDLEDLTLQKRKGARDFLKQIPGSHVLFEKKRKRRKNKKGVVVESEEPEAQP